MKKILIFLCCLAVSSWVDAGSTVALYNTTTTTFTLFPSPQNGKCADGETINIEPPPPILPFSQTQKPTRLFFPDHQACVLMLNPDQAISIAQNTDNQILAHCSMLYHCNFNGQTLTIQ